MSGSPPPGAPDVPTLPAGLTFLGSLRSGLPSGNNAPPP